MDGFLLLLTVPLVVMLLVSITLQQCLVLNVIGSSTCTSLHAVASLKSTAPIAPQGVPPTGRVACSVINLSLSTARAQFARTCAADPDELPRAHRKNRPLRSKIVPYAIYGTWKIFDPFDLLFDKQKCQNSVINV